MIGLMIVFSSRSTMDQEYFSTTYLLRMQFVVRNTPVLMPLARHPALPFCLSE